MRGPLLAVAVLTLVPATASHAVPRPARPFTGCGYVADPSGPSHLSGYLYGQAAAADLPGPGTLPGTAPLTVTLTCSLQSAGYTHGTPDDFSASGTGTGVAVVEPAAFTVPYATSGDSLGLCARVDVTDGSGTWTYWSHSPNGTWRTTPDGRCAGEPRCLAMSYECDPTVAFVTDTVAYVLDLTGVEVPSDPDCAAIGEAAPGLPGVVDVTPEGDVYLAGEWVWDCR